MEQLAPTKQALRRIKLKIFGSCDSGKEMNLMIEMRLFFYLGKTTLVDSLKCSYLNSFFRRNRLNSTRRQMSRIDFKYDKRMLTVDFI